MLTMANIGGNINATIQLKITQKDEAGNTIKNSIGEAQTVWEETDVLVGWLGLQSGDSKYNIHSAKLEESTHVFVCDFSADVYALAAKNTRLICKGMMYDVLLIDNPDEMDEQLEIYLRKVGAYNG